jgi:probable phosphoglycerate mutase
MKSAHAVHVVSQQMFALPEGATELLLIRHGSMSLKPNQPPPDGDQNQGGPLSAIGRVQAEAIAGRLADERVQVFSSPLRRTLETARPLAERLGVETITVEGLREVRLGDWEGAAATQLHDPDNPITAALFANERWDAIPNAEDPETFAQRVRSAIEHVIELAEHGTAAAFTHGGVVAEVCHQATSSRAFAFIGCENASITRLLVFSDGTWMLRGFNDVSHLREIKHSR